MKTFTTQANRRNLLLVGALALGAFASATPSAMADDSYNSSRRYEYRNDDRGNGTRFENHARNRRNQNRRAGEYRSGDYGYGNTDNGDYYGYENNAPGYYGRDDSGYDNGEYYGGGYNDNYGDNHGAGDYYENDPYYSDEPYYGDANNRGGYYGSGDGGILGDIIGGVLGGRVPGNRGGVENDVIGAVLGGVFRR